MQALRKVKRERGQFKASKSLGSTSARESEEKGTTGVSKREHGLPFESGFKSFVSALLSKFYDDSEY